MKGVSYNEVRNIDFSAAKTMNKWFDSQCHNASATPGPPSAKKKHTVPIPTDDELKSFFSKLAATGRKPALLSIVKEHADNYVPKTASARYPTKLNDLRDKVNMTLNYSELLVKCDEINIKMSEEKVANAHVEKITKKQSAEKLWYEFRAGRVTAS